MKKKVPESSPRAGRTAANEKGARFVSTTIEEAKARIPAGLVPFRRMRPVRLGRPLLGERPRKAISIKLDPDLIARLKREAKKKKTKYQSLIHHILERNVPA